MTAFLNLADPLPAAPPRAPAPEGPPSLIGLSREALATTLAESGIPQNQVRMRAAQIWHWLYVRGATDFSAMTNMSKALREELAQKFRLARPEIVTEQVSEDSTRKWLLRFPPAAPAAPSRSKPSTSRKKAAALSASRPRSAARSPAPSATPAPRSWSAT
jgi:23S rRNA (adenine2503-C2)-methyltransferase